MEAAVQEHALWHAAVLLLRLVQFEGAVFEEVVQVEAAHAVRLVGPLVHCFFEERL